MSLFMGTGVALVTPFRKDLSVDVAALEKIINYVIDGGVDYLVVLGTTAESATLSYDEKRLIMRTVVATNKERLPLVLGIGGNDTFHLVQDLKTADFSGFDAILSVSPYYNKPTQKGIYQHFKAVAEASPLPVILYNVPGRTSSNILPETILKLANDFKNIIGVKEAAGDMVQAMRLIQHKPKDFLVISGDDMLALPIVLAGGSGVISVIGQGFPKEFSSLIRLGLEHKAEDAYQIHYKLMDIIDMIFEQGNPAGIKEIFSILKMSENTLRLPLVNINEDLAIRISHFVNKIVN